MPPSPRITIRLTPALEALVSDRVRQGTSVSDLVREALEAYLGVRQTPRPTHTTSASASATAASDTLADNMSDIMSAAISDVSDIRERLVQLEQRVEELSVSVRQSSRLSGTQETLDTLTPRASDKMSDTSRTQVEKVSSIGTAFLSDTRESSSTDLSDTDVPPFDTSKFVLGKLCPRGHEYHGTGKTLRRLFRHVCPACDVERTRAARKAKREGGS
jgi:Arc/MetJ-type ribon-helix-helix transcriptional regulator